MTYSLTTTKQIRGFTKHETERRGNGREFVYTIYDPETYQRFMVKALQLGASEIDVVMRKEP